MYQLIKLTVNRDERGELIAIENSRDVPFPTKRVFYIDKINEKSKRAQHANIIAQQFIVCLRGSCQMLLDDGMGDKATISLQNNDQAVHILPKNWLEIFNFTKDCLLLVLSDFHYDREHQISDYDTFCKAVQ